MFVVLLCCLCLGAEAEKSKAVEASKAPDGLSVVAAADRIDLVPTTNVITKEKNSSEGDHLCVIVVLDNTSQGTKFDYRGSAAAGFLATATVTDDLGNTYRQIDFGSMVIGHGQQKEAAIYPGKKLTDIYYFEPPVKLASKLHMIISTRATGGHGEIVLDFPCPRPAPPPEAKPVEKPAKTAVAKPAPKKPLLRDWTINGTAVRAEFKGRAAGKVKLKQEDGNVTTVDADDLGDADRQWIAKRAR